MTSITGIIFVAIIAIMQLEALPVENSQTQEVKEYFCGSDLTKALADVCKGKYNEYFRKRSMKDGLYYDIFSLFKTLFSNGITSGFFFKINWLFIFKLISGYIPFLWIILNYCTDKFKTIAEMILPQAQTEEKSDRGVRGVENECCDTQCTRSDLKMYCAKDVNWFNVYLKYFFQVESKVLVKKIIFIIDMRNEYKILNYVTVQYLDLWLTLTQFFKLLLLKFVTVKLLILIKFHWDVNNFKVFKIK